MAKRQKKRTISIAILVLGVITGIILWYIQIKPAIAPINVAKRSSNALNSQGIKDYRSKNLKFLIRIHKEFQVEEKFTRIVLSNSIGEIVISRNGTNFDNLENYLQDLHQKNRVEFIDKETFIVNGLNSVSGKIKSLNASRQFELIYFVYVDNWVHVFSTSSDTLFSDL